VELRSGGLKVVGCITVSMQEVVKATRLGFTAGTIDVENLVPFERLLFRATRGNMFLRSSEVGAIMDPNTNKLKQKAVFVVFYAGERAKLKITKVRSLLTAPGHSWPLLATPGRSWPLLAAPK
jgi:V-type H+-transporting ATPase subunit a